MIGVKASTICVVLRPTESPESPDQLMSSVPAHASGGEREGSMGLDKLLKWECKGEQKEREERNVLV
jgi:hypothetical protein